VPLNSSPLKTAVLEFVFIRNGIGDGQNGSMLMISGDKPTVAGATPSAAE
jgi:hypothetical protein